MANDFDDENPELPPHGSPDNKPTKLDEQPFLSDAQFELDDHLGLEPASQWPKIGFGVVVAIGVVLGVMYVKGLGPFQPPPPKVEEVAPVATPPPSAPVPVPVAPAPQPQALPPPPPPPVVPPSTKAETSKKGKKVAAKKAAGGKKKKHHK